MYLGVSQLRVEFPDVRRLSEHALRAFWELPLSARVRDIKHFVRRFENIQYGRVTSRNVPLRRWPSDADEKSLGEWKKWVENNPREKADIEVVS